MLGVSPIIAIIALIVKNSSSSHNTKKPEGKFPPLSVFLPGNYVYFVFVATLLAIEISVAESLLNGMILGVVIWSLFFISALILDAKLTSSILGNMIGYLRKGAAAITGATVNSFFKVTKLRQSVCKRNG